MPVQNEKKEIFRKTTLDKISSPEKLNEYIRVSSPSVWIVLAAIVVIIAAAVFWAATAIITPEGLRPIDLLFSGLAYEGFFNA
jgi:ABC-type transport system involved in cytochrome bd biosynthesis fused ATPase/permease subunit